MEIDCELLHVLYQCGTKRITLIFSKIKKMYVPHNAYFSFDVTNQQIHENNENTKTRLAVCCIVC